MNGANYQGISLRVPVPVPPLGVLTHVPQVHNTIMLKELFIANTLLYHTNYKKSYRLQNQSVKPSRQLQQLTNSTNITQTTIIILVGVG
jgi:hypothetical protein